MRKVPALLATLLFPTAAFSQQPADSPFVPQGYARVSADEFNEPKLDTSKWWTRYIYNKGMEDKLNDEKQRYRENSNHVMTGAALRLTAKKVRDNAADGANYESGMIRSKTTFKYGYFEARVKMPSAKGTWAAFWLNSDATADGKVSWPPEIDIFEFVLNGVEDKPNMIHSNVVVQKPKDGTENPWGGETLFADPKNIGFAKGTWFAPFNFPDAFHIIALLWDTDDTVTTLVDGKPFVKRKYKWVYKDGQDAPYAHVLMNLAIGGQWAGRHGIDDAAFPQALEIDYMRVYQKRDHVLTGTGKIGRDLLGTK